MLENLTPHLYQFDKDSSVPCKPLNCVIASRSRGETMSRESVKVYQGKNYHDESFILDESVFIGCALKNCDLFYAGGDFEWTDTTMENCRFHWRGAAKNSFALFQLLQVATQQALLPKPPTSTQKLN